LKKNHSLIEIVILHRDGSIILRRDLNIGIDVCDDFSIVDNVSFIHDVDGYMDDNLSMNHKSLHQWTLNTSPT